MPLQHNVDLILLSVFVSFMSLMSKYLDNVLRFTLMEQVAELGAKQV